MAENDLFPKADELSSKMSKNEDSLHLPPLQMCTKEDNVTSTISLKVGDEYQTDVKENTPLNSLNLEEMLNSSYLKKTENETSQDIPPSETIQNGDLSNLSEYQACLQFFALNLLLNGHQLDENMQKMLENIKSPQIPPFNEDQIKQMRSIRAGGEHPTNLSSLAAKNGLQLEEEMLRSSSKMSENENSPHPFKESKNEGHIKETSPTRVAVKPPMNGLQLEGEIHRLSSRMSENENPQHLPPFKTIENCHNIGQASSTSNLGVPVSLPYVTAKPPMNGLQLEAKTHRPSSNENPQHLSPFKRIPNSHNIGQISSRSNLGAPVGLSHHTANLPMNGLQLEGGMHCPSSRMFVNENPQHLSPFKTIQNGQHIGQTSSTINLGVPVGFPHHTAKPPMNGLQLDGEMHRPSSRRSANENPQHFSPYKTIQNGQNIGQTSSTSNLGIPVGLPYVTAKPPMNGLQLEREMHSPSFRMSANENPQHFSPYKTIQNSHNLRQTSSVSNLGVHHGNFPPFATNPPVNGCQLQKMAPHQFYRRYEKTKDHTEQMSLTSTGREYPKSLPYPTAKLPMNGLQLDQSSKIRNPQHMPPFKSIHNGQYVGPSTPRRNLGECKARVPFFATNSPEIGSQLEERMHHPSTKMLNGYPPHTQPFKTIRSGYNMEPTSSTSNLGEQPYLATNPRNLMKQTSFMKVGSRCPVGMPYPSARPPKNGFYLEERPLDLSFKVPEEPFNINKNCSLRIESKSQDFFPPNPPVLQENALDLSLKSGHQNSSDSQPFQEVKNDINTGEANPLDVESLEMNKNEHNFIVTDVLREMCENQEYFANPIPKPTTEETKNEVNVESQDGTPNQPIEEILSDDKKEPTEDQECFVDPIPIPTTDETKNEVNVECQDDTPNKMSTEDTSGPTMNKNECDTHKKKSARIGEEYQADLPEFTPNPSESYLQSKEKGHLLWKPIDNMGKVAKYIELAQVGFFLNEEQSLTLLFLNGNDFLKAGQDLSKYVDISMLWNEEDMRIMEKCVKRKEQNFYKIQKKLKGRRTINSIVKMYHLFTANEEIYEIEC
ncbi:uncharacterized protein LOC126264713 [Aethina tumida]|uniref:uncharacterized protein LOC126264713 n=1 Tax=Aethina tumida TaxID=116153 RepID=UPI002148E79F|nr:uncharacterized protein LOC126264713 [Aethina tumida]